jgi:peptide/nickel transport system substrate-binding protein
VTEIVYLPIADAATRVAALLSGEVDIVQDVPVQDVERLQATDGIKVETGPENRVIYFGYRFGEEPLRSSNITDRNPFNDPRVREAMELAIDRDAIQQVVMRGQSIPTGVANPPFVNGWTEELNAYPTPDIERAQALLAEAGYPDGFTVTLDTPNNRYVNDEAISQAVAGMLGRIGIQVTLASRPIAQHSPLVINSETDFYLLGWGVPTFDSAYVFNDLVHTKEGDYGAYNAGLYSNPELDAKIKSLGTEVDTEARNATIAEIWEVVKADRVLLPIHNQVLAYAMRDNVNLAVHPENQPLMSTVTFAD